MTSVRFLLDPKLIGGNAILVESDNSKIVLDCGMEDRSLWPPVFFAKKPLDYIKRFGGVPKIPSDVDGILITHGHVDHYSGLFAQESNYKVYLTNFVKYNVELAQNWSWAKDYRLHRHKFLPLESTMEFGDIKVNPIPVSHSTIEAYAFIIESSDVQILYTGNFRMKGYRETDFSKVDDVDLLLLDSTNLNKVDPKIRESDVTEGIGDILENKEGIIIINVLSSNIQRIEQIVSKAHKIGKRVFATPDIRRKYSYAADKNGLEKVDETFKYGLTPNSVVITGFFDGYYSEKVWEFTYHLLDEKGTVVVSHNTEIDQVKQYNKKRLREDVKRLGASFSELHASGHAYRAELKDVIDEISPKKTILMHTTDATTKEITKLHDSVAVLESPTVPLISNFQ